MFAPLYESSIAMSIQSDFSDARTVSSLAMAFRKAFCRTYKGGMKTVLLRRKYFIPHKKWEVIEEASGHSDLLLALTRLLLRILVLGVQLQHLSVVRGVSNVIE
jgi:hypothetical protein